MKKIVSLVAAVALVGATLPITTISAEARPGYRKGGYAAAYRGGPRRGYYRGARNAAGAAAAVGIAGALIGGAIAASQRPRYYEDPYYGGGYGYARPAYGYGGGYGYAPGYYDDGY